MSKHSTSKRAKRQLRRLICILIAVIAIAALLKTFAIEPIKGKIIGAITEQYIRSQLPSGAEPGADIDTEAILDSMDKQDREKIEQIARGKVTPQAIRDVTSYVKSGDREGLKEYARNSLSDEEIGEMKGIYEKYKDDIMKNIR